MTRRDTSKLAVSLADIRPQMLRLQRRGVLRGLSLGAAAMLTGCDLKVGDAVDKVLWAMSRFNDRVQALLFNPNRLAPTYDAAQVTRPFPYNGFYPADDAPEIDDADWKLEVSGLVEDRTPWTLERLRQLPQEGQITRLICIEGWSAIGSWSGVPLRVFLERIGADTNAKYVGFRCADRYYSSLDMPSALHPQTILALDFAGQPLPTEFGFPVKVRVPTKLGFKSPKFVRAMFVTNDYPGGYWEDQGYNWFSGS
jgi:DMSO/TMAO reductase YedYZ molybdopterin-dependent catalytic subunit